MPSMRHSVMDIKHLTFPSSSFDFILVLFLFCLGNKQDKGTIDTLIYGKASKDDIHLVLGEINRVLKVQYQFWPRLIVKPSGKYLS